MRHRFTGFVITTLAAGLLALGCGDDGGGETPAQGTDAATTGQDDTTGGTTTGDAGSTTGGEDAVAPPIDEGGGTTGGDEGSTTGGEDTPLVVNPDGKNGSPCETEADCQPDYLCAFGFCAQTCRDADGPIAGTCQEISNANTYTDNWGCPEDLIICMPGPWAGKNAICQTDEYCAATLSAAYSCAGPIGLGSGKIASGLCVPWAHLGGAGAACETGDDCASGACSTGGFCFSMCQKNTHCPDGNLCQAIPLQPDPEVSAVPTLWAPFCTPTDGSLKYCFKQSACPDGEVCSASIEPNSLKPQYHCITGVDGGSDLGSACTEATACASGNCVLGGIDGGPESGFCANTCQNDPADCGDTGMHCGQLVLHENGTDAATNSDDDITFGLCVFGAPGDDCILGGSWCELDYSVCEQVEGGLEGLGACSEPPSGCADGGPPCNDGLSCTVDTCDEVNNECDFSVLEADTCLIDGECYAKGDPSPANPCLVCDPAAGATAWTAGNAGGECDAGDVCKIGACDDNGACIATAKDCSDAKDCTEDSCDAGTGDCINDLFDGVCLIEGVCYSAGDASAENACMVCSPGENGLAWVAAAENASCDDGVACTGDGTCQAGSCVAGADSCDDGLDCTTEACNAGTGECDVTIGATSCVISETCYDEGAASAPGSCMVCTTATSQTEWTQAADATGCDDGKACTESDVCTGGTCDGTSTCDDSKTCTVDSCGADGQCVFEIDGPTCLIDSTCYADGAPSAGDPCQKCDQATANSAWTPCADGEQCGCPGDETCQTGACAAP